MRVSLSPVRRHRDAERKELSGRAYTKLLEAADFAVLLLVLHLHVLVRRDVGRRRPVRLDLLVAALPRHLARGGLFAASARGGRVLWLSRGGVCVSGHLARCCRWDGVTRRGCGLSGNRLREARVGCVR